VKNTIPCIKNYTLNITNSEGLEYLKEISKHLLYADTIGLEELWSEFFFDLSRYNYTITLTAVYNKQTETSFPVVFQQISSKRVTTNLYLTVII